MAGRTVVGHLSKLIIELDDKHNARGAKLEKQMERLVNISQDRLAFEQEKFEFEKQKFAEQRANSLTQVANYRSSGYTYVTIHF